MPNQEIAEIVPLDRSVSRADLHKDMEGGFGAFVAAQKETPGERVLGVVQFDTQVVVATLECCRIADVPAHSTVPRGRVPLLAGMVGA